MPPDKAGIIPRLRQRSASTLQPVMPVNSPQIPVAVRPSGCPGLLRIVQALDGGICRIKLAGGAISTAQARAVADGAERFAAGVIEATNRANLQIRGIGADHSGLIDSLLAAGLGPTTVAGDDVRNLMLSPTAGIDRQRLVDTRPLAQQILATLQSHPRFAQLSAKFAVQLDGGEALAMLDHHHDLWLSACTLAGQPALAFGVAGCLRDRPLAAVPLAQGHDLVVAVLEWFLDHARPEHNRMRQLLVETPVDKLLADLATRLPLLAIADWQRAAPTAGLHLGTYPQGDSGYVYVGAAAPLGRLDPAKLRGAAHLAQAFGDGSLRLTPWQSLLLPNIRAEDGPQVLAALEQLGLLGSADQALAHVIACTGSPGCAKAQADTKADAVRLAALLQGTERCTEVHLSGCPRSCAAAHPAAVTLLAVAPGHYDLYFSAAGLPGFGAPHARNLTIEAAGALLGARPRSHP